MHILNVRYDNITIEAAKKAALALVRGPSKREIFFLNLDCFRIAQEDEAYRRILEQAALVLPDGIGIRLVTRLFGGRMLQNCNGTDFSPILLRAAAAENHSVFLLGGREGVAEAASRKLVEKIPDLRIAGTHSGYLSDDARVIKMINDSGADILLVAMGVPLQEKWIHRHQAELRPGLCLGVGALFDFLSGRIRRAPMWIRKIHLEWCWRILTDPKRLGRRYLVDGVKILFYAFKKRFILPPLGK